jgi:hypothetical protein
VREWWAATIKPTFPHLSLFEREPVSLSPYVRGRGTKKERASLLSVLDFLVSDTRGRKPTNLFHIEQKTGPGSIATMTESQLDVNDFNDIAGAINKTGLPSYVLHVQAGQDYNFPTRKTTILGMWWTDVFTLLKHQKRIKARRGEDKKAIYYTPSAFRPIDSFPDEITSMGYKKLATQLSKGPLPLL